MCHVLIFYDCYFFLILLFQETLEGDFRCCISKVCLYVKEIKEIVSHICGFEMSTLFHGSTSSNIELPGKVPL